VFKFIASREFTRADFPASGVNTHRIARPVITELLKRCLLPDRDILGAATWLRDVVMAHGIAATPSRNPSRPHKHRAKLDWKDPALTGLDMPGGPLPQRPRSGVLSKAPLA